ncbi:MAG TPA: hypothetical protein VF207_00405 [Chthoniobacterales bacterium]
MRTTIKLPERTARRWKAAVALTRGEINAAAVSVLHGATARPARKVSEGSVSGSEWITRWQRLGRQIEKHSADDRTCVGILRADRR